MFPHFPSELSLLETLAEHLRDQANRATRQGCRQLLQQSTAMVEHLFQPPLLPGHSPLQFLEAQHL